MISQEVSSCKQVQSWSCLFHLELYLLEANISTGFDAWTMSFDYHNNGQDIFPEIPRKKNSFVCYYIQIAFKIFSKPCLLIVGKQKYALKIKHKSPIIYSRGLAF